MLRQVRFKRRGIYRAIVEYVATLGIAVLASYLILGARW